MTECRVPSTRDGCAVPTRALAGVVQEWVNRWERDHPDLAGVQKTSAGRRIGGGGTRRNALGQLSGNGAVGAVTILHERTRMEEAASMGLQPNDPQARGVPKKAIRNMLANRSRDFTELRTADLIVSAIERPEAFHDGTLPIVPNPRASEPARASCCGGSLNGAVAPAT